jgi:hypothetical protein
MSELSKLGRRHGSDFGERLLFVCFEIDIDLLMEFASLGGDIIMEMINVAGNVVGVSMSFSEGEFVEFFVRRGGVVALRVHGFRSSKIKYIWTRKFMIKFKNWFIGITSQCDMNLILSWSN